MFTHLTKIKQRAKGMMSKRNSVTSLFLSAESSPGRYHVQKPSPSGDGLPNGAEYRPTPGFTRAESGGREVESKWWGKSRSDPTAPSSPAFGIVSDIDRAHSPMPKSGCLVWLLSPTLLQRTKARARATREKGRWGPALRAKVPWLRSSRGSARSRDVVDLAQRPNGWAYFAHLYPLPTFAVAPSPHPAPKLVNSVPAANLQRSARALWLKQPPTSAAYPGKMCLTNGRARIPVWKCGLC
ncbi:uncharacterized protein B0H64DRAFT_210927 [Chaetomium fimeti]|uniref:Uncharacterized protein n=1 Tax=Chaetomium fimeti TaxID=1854472 RepID=A0AAE0LPS4_9PEZI|nr:hypothetical protein B0H64DRAFT_210927 [Chaetomium fimeti]